MAGKRITEVTRLNGPGGSISIRIVNGSCYRVYERRSTFGSLASWTWRDGVDYPDLESALASLSGFPIPSM